MSDLVKLSAALPADEETNGLDALHDALVEDPTTIRCALVWLDVPKVVIKTGEEPITLPYVRIRRIEPIGTISEVPAAITNLVARKAEQRTGKAPLPFDEVEKWGHDDRDEMGEDPPFYGRADVTEDAYVFEGGEDE